jgi:hypothetical protein
VTLADARVFVALTIILLIVINIYVYGDGSSYASVSGN